MIPTPALLALTWARNNKAGAAVAVLAVAFLVTAGVQTVRLSFVERALERVRLELGAARGAYEAARADAEEKARLVGVQYRAQEARFQRDKETAEANHAARLKAAEARAAVLARDNLQLRQLAEAVARGPAPGGAPDSLAACRDDAARLGQLFGEADAAAGELAAAADRHADEVRLLLEAARAGRLRILGTGRNRGARIDARARGWPSGRRGR